MKTFQYLSCFSNFWGEIRLIFLPEDIWGLQMFFFRVQTNTLIQKCKIKRQKNTQLQTKFAGASSFSLNQFLFHLLCEESLQVVKRWTLITNKQLIVFNMLSYLIPRVTECKNKQETVKLNDFICCDKLQVIKLLMGSYNCSFCASALAARTQPRPGHRLIISGVKRAFCQCFQ